MRSPTAGEGVLFKGCMVLKTGRGQEVYEQGVTIATGEPGCARHHSAVFVKCSNSKLYIIDAVSQFRKY